MTVLLLHGGGWDELALMGGAIVVAFLVVKLTTRGGAEAPDEEAVDGVSDPGRPEKGDE